MSLLSLSSLQVTSITHTRVHTARAVTDGKGRWVEPSGTRGAASARQGAGWKLPSLLFLALPSLICAIHMYTVAEAFVASGTGASSLLVSYISVWLCHVYRVPSLGMLPRRRHPRCRPPSFSCPPFEGGISMDAIAHSMEGHPRCRRRRKRIGPAVHTGGSQYFLSWLT